MTVAAEFSVVLKALPGSVSVGAVLTAATEIVEVAVALLLLHTL